MTKNTNTIEVRDVNLMEKSINFLTSKGWNYVTSSEHVTRFQAKSGLKLSLYVGGGIRIHSINEFVIQTGW